MSGNQGRANADRTQEIMRRRLTRRSLLKGAGVGVAGFSLAAFLAACGEDGGGGGNGGNGGGTTGGATGTTASDIFSTPDPEQHVEFANWPLYIDKARDDSGPYNPSLRLFTEGTGISVNYLEIIQSNEEFFARIQPVLTAGDSTGYDIIVITNGRQLTTLTRNGWVVPLDPGRRPNFDANAATWAKDPAFDPGNRYTMAWQSGITGIAVNHDLAAGEITRIEDLLDASKLPDGSVGMISGDTPDWTMINLGIDPTTSGPEEWKTAAEFLQRLRDAPTFRKFYDQGYADDMSAGNLAATMAWSGDVLYYAQWAGFDNLEFIFPEGGALIWVDNMMIPAGAEHPVSAYTLMDYVYQPEIAAMITEYVLYMSPVTATRDVILTHADEAEAEGSKGLANKLRATAGSPFLYPDDEFLSRTSFGFSEWTDEAAEEWDAIFNPIIYG